MTPTSCCTRSTKTRRRPRSARAQQLLLSEPWGWSIQVAAEFFVNAISPKRPFRLDSADAAAMVEIWLIYPTLPLTADLVRAAMRLHRRFQIGYWDAAIIPVQVDLLADAWARHQRPELTEASLLDAAVVYAACMTVGQVLAGRPSRPSPGGAGRSAPLLAAHEKSPAGGRITAGLKRSSAPGRLSLPPPPPHADPQHGQKRPDEESGGFGNRVELLVYFQRIDVVE